MASALGGVAEAPAAGAALSSGRSRLPPGRIRSVRFKYMSPQEIAESAVVKLTNDKLHHNKVPLPNAPHSPYLGPPSSRVLCATCGRDTYDCPGHRGVIELQLPMFNPFHTAHQLLLHKVTCHVCGRVKAAEDDPVWAATAHLKGHMRLKAVADAVKTRRVCPHEGCRVHQPAFSEKKGVITRSWAAGQRSTRASDPPLPGLGDTTSQGAHNLACFILDTADAALVSDQLRPFNAADARDALAALHPGDALRVGLTGVENPEGAWAASSAAPGALAGAPAPPPVDAHHVIMANIAVVETGLRPNVSAMEGSKRTSTDHMTAQYKRMIRERNYMQGTLDAAWDLLHKRDAAGLPLTPAEAPPLPPDVIKGLQFMLARLAVEYRRRQETVAASTTKARDRENARKQLEAGPPGWHILRRMAELPDPLAPDAALPHEQALWRLCAPATWVLRVVAGHPDAARGAADSDAARRRRPGRPRKQELEAPRLTSAAIASAARKRGRATGDAGQTAASVGLPPTAGGVPREQLAPGDLTRGEAKLLALADTGMPHAALISGRMMHRLLVTSPDAAARMDKLRDTLQAHLTADAATGRTGRGGRGSSGKSVKKTLSGKKGELRNNGVGKRVDFSARAVIACDPRLPLDVVGVPSQDMGASQTVPETVVAWPLVQGGGRTSAGAPGHAWHSPNLSALQGAILRGPGVVGGATTVLRPDGTHIRLRKGAAGEASRSRVAAALQPGDRVERHIRDGDVMLFNRQPSLHEASLNAVKVALRAGAVFTMPQDAAGPYNADFDGDEMNLHMPQSEAATAEASVIMELPNRVVSRKTGMPVVGFIQDTLVGATLLTQPDTVVPRQEAYDVLHAAEVPLAAIPAGDAPGGDYTGRGLMSVLLPRITGVWPGEHGDAGDPTDDRVVRIEDGRLVSGVLTKAHLGTSSGGIIHRVFLQHGARIAARFITQARRALDAWVAKQGFSTTLRDVVPPAPARAATRVAVSALERATARVQAAADAAARAGAASEYELQEAEGAIQNRLSAALDAAHRTGAAAWLEAPHNGMYIMSLSGAKGSRVNRTQCALVVGQQTIDGARLGPDAAGVTLPPFARHAPQPQAHGFIAGSYTRGMSVTEVFRACQAGTSNLVDTACRTAVTGYIQRSMMAALQAVMVHADSSVRDSRGRLLMPIVGGDGRCGGTLERVPMPALAAPPSRLAAAWVGAPEAAAAVTRLQAVARRWRGADTWRLPRKVPLPFNAANMMAHEAAMCAQKDGGQWATAAGGPAVLADMVLAACEVLARRGNASAAALWQLSLLTTVTPARVAAAGVTPAGVRQMMVRVVSATVRATAPCGDAVGPLAASAVGEPATQMTLNTFHAPGAVVTEVTQGVPRFKELLNGAKATVSTPLMFLAMSRRACAVAAASHPHQPPTAPLLSALPGLMLHQVVAASYLEDAAVAGACGKDAVHRRVMADMYGGGRDGATRGVTVRIRLRAHDLRLRGLTPARAAAACVRALQAPCRGGPPRCPVAVSFSDVTESVWVLRLEGWAAPLSAAHARAVQRHVLEHARLTGVRAIAHAAPWDRPTVAVDAAGGLAEGTAPGVMALGSGLARLAGHPALDWLSCTTNHTADVLTTLGVGAARRVLTRQITEVFGGATRGRVDTRHVQMLAAWITHFGGLLPVTRNGINRVGNGPLREAAFEECDKRLSIAAQTGSVDRLSDTISAVLMGQLTPVGTGRVGVVQLPSAASHGVRHVSAAAQLCAPIKGRNNPLRARAHAAGTAAAARRRTSAAAALGAGTPHTAQSVLLAQCIEEWEATPMVRSATGVHVREAQGDGGADDVGALVHSPCAARSGQGGIEWRPTLWAV